MRAALLTGPVADGSAGAARLIDHDARDAARAALHLSDQRPVEGASGLARVGARKLADADMSLSDESDFLELHATEGWLMRRTLNDLSGDQTTRSRSIDRERQHFGRSAYIDLPCDGGGDQSGAALLKKSDRCLSSFNHRSVAFDLLIKEGNNRTMLT